MITANAPSTVPSAGMIVCTVSVTIGKFGCTTGATGTSNAMFRTPANGVLAERAVDGSSAIRQASAAPNA